MKKITTIILFFSIALSQKPRARDLGVQFEDTKDDSGLTGKNVALGLFFWPGIIVNERQAKANSKSVNDRITHLNRIYSKKCIKDEE